MMDFRVTAALLAAPLLIAPLLSAFVLFAAARHAMPSEGTANPATALVEVYPAFLERIAGNELVWKDGTRMPIDDGKGDKSFDAMLADPDIKDMFAMTYPAGDRGIPPGVNSDPGRARYEPLFEKMYGDCRAKNLVADAGGVVWLRKKYGKTIKFSKINGAAAQLQKVSDELDGLPDRFLDYMRPLQGTYNCRPIAGTDRPSAHGLGIAIDLAEAHTHYWRWSKPEADGHIAYKNEMPWEIVRIFEKHGFIWGGKWYHYDTMHFEYRPEILANAK
jgi:D-alanyl-D-alanine carboxypeptidase